jgi:tetratricopeptide (TPR) repeat protein
LGSFQKLASEKPHTRWVIKATYEIGNVWVTAGEQRFGDSSAYRQAIESFQNYLLLFPEGEQRGEAYLGLSLAYEELDQLDRAVESLEKARAHYPAPQVIDIKLARIQERRKRRLR